MTAVIPWAVLCGEPHEWTDELSGMGIVLYDREEYGMAMRECPDCIEIREDVQAWLRERGSSEGLLRVAA